jgi:hypothetical protein
MPNEIAVLRAVLRTNPEYHNRLRELAEAGAIKPWDGVEAEVGTIVAAPEHFGITGAKQAQCGCGTRVWLSPSTQAMIIARGAVPQPRIICVWCFHKELRETFETQRTN